MPKEFPLERLYGVAQSPSTEEPQSPYIEGPQTPSMEGLL